MFLKNSNIRIAVLACLFVGAAFKVDAQKDTTYKPFSYVRVGLDLARIPVSLANKTFNAYELQIESNFRKDIWMLSEFGFGNSIASNQYVKYKSSNVFLRYGIDKTFFDKEFPGDLDNSFVGLRYGLSYVNRSEAAYAIFDPIWGNSTGLIKQKNVMAHWLELIAGFKVELRKNLFMGWTVRGKALVNPKAFELLPPPYLAGYGRGDKNTAFGYSFYLLYGFGNRFMKK